MGLFDRFRSSTASIQRVEGLPYSATVEYSGRDYHGKTFDSPDGKWTAVVARASRPREHRTFLFRGSKFMFTATGERPESCAVANTGVVLVADWLAPDKTELGGEIYALDPSGDICIQGSLDANVDNPAISADGRFGSISTYQPDTTTYVFDLQTGELLTEHEHLHGNVGAVSFEKHDENWVIRLSFPDGSYMIDVDGSVVEKSAELREAEKRERLMESTDVEKLREAIAMLEAEDNREVEHQRGALPRELADTKWRLAKEIRKEWGETDEWWSNLNDALLYYLEAHPPSAGMRGAAKILRVEGKHYEKNGQIERALACFRRIEELEEQRDLSLLTEADVRRLRELPKKLDR